MRSRLNLRLFSLTCLTSLAASATGAPLAIPSDPTAKYFLLEDRGGAGWATLLIERVGPGGVRYFWRGYDCRDRTVSYAGEADSLQALRHSKTGPFRVRVADGTVDHDLWIEACEVLQTPEQKRMGERMAADERRMDLEVRIRKIRPHRRDSPLRSTNISDDEVRQIQVAANQVLLGAIVNIGDAVTGCPCEDGALCSDQVWIVAYRPGKSVGLLLSKIDRQWQVGPVQQWWLDYEALQARPGGLSMKDDDAMTDRFPKCPTQPAVARDALSLPLHP